MSSAALFSTTLLAAVYVSYIVYNYNPFSLLYLDKSIEVIPYVDTKNLEDQLSKNMIDLTTLDKFGRNFLMNYFIQQNQELEKINEKIKKPPKKVLNFINFNIQKQIYLQ